MRKTITAEYLRLLDEKFEEGIIVCLDLSNKGFSAAGEIGKCTSLTVLNISKNSLSALDSISGLPSLKFVNISYNSIRDISGLNQCPALIKIEALGNTVSEMRSVLALDSLQSLKVLNLQSMTKEDANPVCKENGYRATIVKALPQLQRLDFLPRSVSELEQVGPEEELKLDLSSLKAGPGDFYGDLGELERALNEAKKAEIRTDSAANKIAELHANCKKKQTQTDEALKELEKLLG